MKTSLRVRLSLAFLAVVLAMALLYGLLANTVLSRQFEQFARSKNDRQINSLVSLLGSRYADWGGRWDESGLESLGVNALEQGLLLRLTAYNGQELWNARKHNDGMCDAILANIAQTMQTQNNSFQGGYVEASYPILSGSQQVATAVVGYYGPYFYSDLDIKFLNTLNTFLVWGALITAVAAVALGVLLARQLSRPITRVIAAAHDIAGGHYDCRIPLANSTREMDDLTGSVNRLAETLGRQDSLRRQLTSDVAHELRTPLTIVQSHLEAMIDGTWPMSQERLANCHREVERMSRLLGGLEQLTQLERQNAVMAFAPVALDQVLAQVAASFAAEFSSKSVRLDVQTVPLQIEGNTDKLSQVLANLLSNALKYTEAGGHVSLVLQDRGDLAAIGINDTGIGIGPEDLPFIFERFYRADKSRTRSTGGSGIGLTIARSIVEAHGGTITVTSEPGKGSEFWILLPKTQGE